MKIVINKCYGGFQLSDKAIERLKELAEKENDKELLEAIEEDKRKEEFRIHGHKYWGFLSTIEKNKLRTHPLLIKVVEELGNEASGELSELKIIEIPDDIEYEIEEYDGIEWVSEKHRRWE
jgi:hypothetical protein